MGWLEYIFRENVNNKCTSVWHLCSYIWCSQLDLPLRLQENLCVYRCVRMHSRTCAYVYGCGVRVEVILLKFVIDSLSVSRWKWDILWNISDLILGRHREICELVNKLANRDSKAPANSSSFLVAPKFKSVWMWMKFMGKCKRRRISHSFMSKVSLCESQRKQQWLRGTGRFVFIW